MEISVRMAGVLAAIEGGHLLSVDVQSSKLPLETPRRASVNGKRTEQTLTIRTQHVRSIAGHTLGLDVSFKIILSHKSGLQVASFNDAFDCIPFLHFLHLS